jgi:ArsR family transcriptional regulator
MTNLTLQDTNQIFKAFADENRIRILHLLTLCKEICVCDIESALDMPQSKVSRHLSYLKNAGLIDSRREGQWAYYKLSRPETNLHRNMVKCVKSCFEDVPALQEDVARLKKTVQDVNSNGNGGSCCP